MDTMGWQMPQPVIASKGFALEADNTR